MQRKVWLGVAAAVLAVGAITLATPRLAGMALILLCLGAVALVAFRLL